MEFLLLHPPDALLHLKRIKVISGPIDKCAAITPLSLELALQQCPQNQTSQYENNGPQYYNLQTNDAGLWTSASLTAETILTHPSFHARIILPVT